MKLLQEVSKLDLQAVKIWLGHFLQMNGNCFSRFTFIVMYHAFNFEIHDKNLKYGKFARIISFLFSYLSCQYETK